MTENVLAAVTVCCVCLFIGSMFGYGTGRRDGERDGRGEGYHDGYWLGYRQGSQASEVGAPQCRDGGIPREWLYTEKTS
jgi:hypothetical protein